MNSFYSRSPDDFHAEASAIFRLLTHLGRAPGHDIVLFPEPRPGAAWVGDLDPAALTPGAGSLAIYTSGTTGAPKARSHAVDKLFDMPRRGGAQDRWLLCYSPLRWAGLSVLRHVVCTGAELVLPRSLRPQDLAAAVGQATHVSLTPSLLRKLAYAGLEPEPRMQQVTLGGEWASQSALDLARALFPKARVSHVYASTELGDICSASDGLAGFPVERLKQAVLTEAGELLIAGLGTGDLWEIRQDRYHFLGRAAEQISVGGALVSASTVEEAAMSHPQVAQAHAFAIRNAVLGQAIALDYVGEAPADGLKAHLAGLLPKVARPMLLRQVDDIRLSATGKLSRSGGQ